LSLAGKFQGNVDVTGSLSKSGGGFKIDHPFEPTEKYLNHSFVESPERKNVYDGIAILDDSGQAVVELPAWFQAVNSDFRYQLTCVGAFAPVFIRDELSNSRFVIAGGRSGMKVCWQVTGIRSDKWAVANPLQIEENKHEIDRGSYRHPELYELETWGNGRAHTHAAAPSRGQVAEEDCSTEFPHRGDLIAKALITR
jgi:hypothetical protein